MRESIERRRYGKDDKYFIPKKPEDCIPISTKALCEISPCTGQRIDPAFIEKLKNSKSHIIEKAMAIRNDK